MNPNHPTQRPMTRATCSFLIMTQSGKQPDTWNTLGVSPAVSEACVLPGFSDDSSMQGRPLYRLTFPILTCDVDFIDPSLHCGGDGASFTTVKGSICKIGLRPSGSG